MVSDPLEFQKQIKLSYNIYSKLSIYLMEKLQDSLISFNWTNNEILAPQDQYAYYGKKLEILYPQVLLDYPNLLRQELEESEFCGMVARVTQLDKNVLLGLRVINSLFWRNESVVMALISQEQLAPSLCNATHFLPRCSFRNFNNLLVLLSHRFHH